MFSADPPTFFSFLSCERWRCFASAPLLFSCIFVCSWQSSRSPLLGLHLCRRALYIAKSSVPFLLGCIFVFFGPRHLHAQACGPACAPPTSSAFEVPRGFPLLFVFVGLACVVVPFLGRAKTILPVFQQSPPLLLLRMLRPTHFVDASFHAPLQASQPLFFFAHSVFVPTVSSFPAKAFVCFFTAQQYRNVPDLRQGAQLPGSFSSVFPPI